MAGDVVMPLDGDVVVEAAESEDRHSPSGGLVFAVVHYLASILPGPARPC
jgi:hypothetical protein